MFLEMILNRRSIRNYSEKLIEKEKIETLKKTLLLAPSSRSFDPCQFIFVTRKFLLEKISVAKPDGASFLIGAPLAVVVIAEESKSDVWIEDAALATTYLLLSAHWQGLGSCWVQIRQREYSPEMSAEKYIKKLLNIPDEFRVLSMVGIGYAAEQRTPYSLTGLDFRRIHDQEFGATKNIEIEMNSA